MVRLSEEDYIFNSTYTRYAHPDLSPSFNVAVSLVRAALLESTLKESHSCEVSSEVLLELVQLLLQEDTTLSIAFLLGLSQPEEAEELFKRLPRTALVLQLACYYFALQLYANLQPITVLPEDLYIYSPSYLIKQAVHVLHTDEVTNFEKLKICASLLRKYNKLLSDFIQAEILKTYGGGVDVARFTQDDIYKHETILGLAMTLEKPVLQVAVSLAHKYGLSLWDIYMTHLEFLFSDTSLTTLELENRVKELRMHETLTSQPEKMCERLQEYVYPNIDGTDHSRLVFYYSLLEECGDIEDCHKITPSSHLKTLKKLKSACPRINYKDLLEPMSSQFDVLYKALTEGNVHVFAKLAPKIPSQDGRFLTSSNILRIWSTKYFFESCQRNKTKPETLSQWISHFSSCEEFFKRLTPKDYLEFINEITFTKTALKKLSFEARYEITRKAEKFVQTKTEGEESEKWEEVLEQLHHNFEHFKRLEDEIVVEMKTSSNAAIQGYAEEFDLSRSVPEKVRVMLLRAVMEAQPHSLLQNLLALCPPEMAWEPMDAFTESITLVTEQLRNPDKTLHPALEKSDPLNILDAILKQLSDNTEELLTGELALEVLRPFCNDSSVPVSLRLRVLQLLEKTVDLLPEDLALLLLFRTQVVITDSWPDFHVQEEKILSEEGRQELFDFLLNKSENIKHITALSDVLNCWPSLTPSDPAGDVWSRLLLKLLSLPAESGVLEETVKLVKKALSRTSFTPECGKVIYEEVQNHGSYMHSLKVALLLGSKEMQDEAISLLNTYTQVSENDYDEELLSLLLHQHLVPHTLATNLYGPIIKHLLDTENEEERQYNVECVVRELYNTGHRAEAGSLLLLANNMHPVLSTFGSALGVLQRFIHRT